MIGSTLIRLSALAWLVCGSALGAQQVPARDSGKAAAASTPETKAQEAAGDARAGEAAAAESKGEPSSGSRAAPVVRRDPFRPFTTAARGSLRRRENLTPLERYDLGQLKLVGVIWDVKEPNAMIEDSVGLGYIVKVGTPIGVNDGKVKAIRPGEIVVEETYIDIYGARKKRDVSILLHLEKVQ